MDELIYDLARRHVEQHDVPTVIVPVTVDGEPALLHGFYHDTTPEFAAWNEAAHQPENQVAVAILCCTKAHRDAPAHGADPA